VAYSESQGLILSVLSARELTFFPVRGPEHGSEDQSRFGLYSLTHRYPQNTVFDLSLHTGLQLQELTHSVVAAYKRTVSSPSVPCDVLVTSKPRHSTRSLLFGSVSKKKN
jgi:hypothetical protein